MDLVSKPERDAVTQMKSKVTMAAALPYCPVFLKYMSVPLPSTPMGEQKWEPSIANIFWCVAREKVSHERETANGFLPNQVIVLHGMRPQILTVVPHTTQNSRADVCYI